MSAHLMQRRQLDCILRGTVTCQSNLMGIIYKITSPSGKHVPQQRDDDLCENTGVDMDFSSVRVDVGKGSGVLEEAYLKSGRGHSRRLPAGMYDSGSPSARFRVQQIWD